MGAITKASQEMAQRQQGGGFEQLLRRSWPRIAAVMPSNLNPERMYQLAMSCYNQTRNLDKCSGQSVLSCLMKCSALGMEPSAVDGLGRAYIIPRRNKRTGGYEATFMLGYKGMIDLARRSGQILSIEARAVREGDEFEYSYGLDERLRHVPSMEPIDDRPLTHVYMVAKFKDGGHYIDVMSRAEVDAVRRRSMASEEGPWVTDYEAMARKTVIRRAFPYLPVSVEAQRAAASDETTPVALDSAGVEMFPEMSVPVGVDPETGEVTDASAALAPAGVAEPTPVTGA